MKIHPTSQIFHELTIKPNIKADREGHDKTEEHLVHVMGMKSQEKQ